MKRTFAIPTEAKKACAHFGRCDSFAVIEVEDGKIVAERYVDPPVHQPGTYPRYLAEQGVDTILAGGMGVMAQNLFRENGIDVHLGVGVEDPRVLVQQFLQNELETDGNLCDHGSDGEPHHRCED